LDFTDPRHRLLALLTLHQHLPATLAATQPSRPRTTVATSRSLGMRGTRPSREP
jgi:hypothetical protein